MEADVRRRLSDSTCEPDFGRPKWRNDPHRCTSFKFVDFGPGEASDESVIVVPSMKAAFVGDLIYQDMHPWLAEGRSELWLQQLDRLQRSVPADFAIYPGHGAIAHRAVIAAQRSYIQAFRAATKSAMGRRAPVYLRRPLKLSSPKLARNTQGGPSRC